MIRKRMIRSGDGSNRYSNIKDLNVSHLAQFVQDHHDNVEPIWGWDDPNMSQDERELVNIINAEKAD